METIFVSLDPQNAFTVSFTLDKFDYDSLTNVWNNIKNNSLPVPGYKLNNIDNQMVPLKNIDGTTITKLSTIGDAIWVFLANTFATAFSFSPIRICNASMIPVYNSNRVTVDTIDVKFTIVNIPTPDQTLLNDNLTAICIGEWIIQVIDPKDGTNDTIANKLKLLKYAPAKQKVLLLNIIFYCLYLIYH